MNDPRICIWKQNALGIAFVYGTNRMNLNVVNP